jgi:hypothetical protein
MRTLLLLVISAVALTSTAPAIAQGVPGKLLRQRQCQESLPASVRYGENRGRWLMNPCCCEARRSECARLR